MSCYCEGGLWRHSAALFHSGWMGWAAWLEGQAAPFLLRTLVHQKPPVRSADFLVIGTSSDWIASEAQPQTWVFWLRQGL